MVNILFVSWQGSLNNGVFLAEVSSVLVTVLLVMAINLLKVISAVNLSRLIEINIQLIPLGCQGGYENL